MRRRCEIIACCLLSCCAMQRLSAQESLPPVVRASSAWLDLNQPAPPSSLPAVVPRAESSGSVYTSVDSPAPRIVPSASPPPPHSLPTQLPAELPAPSAVPPTFARPNWPAHLPPIPVFDPDAEPTSITAPHAGSFGTSHNLPLDGASALGQRSLQSSPFSLERQPESPWEEEIYDRMLDLYPDGNDRQLIERVRETVLQTELGVDTTDEEWITVSGNGRRISWGGRIDIDAAQWARDDDFGAVGQPNYVEFRRLRLVAAGEGYGIYDFQLEVDFSPEFDELNIEIPSAENFGVEIKDAFIGLRDIPVLGYTMIGHFRTPIGLESLNSSRNIPFLERSLNNRLLPGRELGIGAFNYAPDLNLTWAYGYFFHELEETERSIIDDNQGSRFISRVTFAPYYDERTAGGSLFHTGFGYAYTRPRLIDQGFFLPPVREVRFTGQPELHQTPSFITTQILDVQQYQLFNLELAWAHGPFTLQSEGTLAEIDLANGERTNVWGTYVHGSWFLTGERRPYDRRFGIFQRVQPYENFWLVRTPGGSGAGVGAWELALRWSHLNFTDVTDQYMHDLTVGVNWYWNPHTRLMFNWIHPMVHNSNRFDPVLNAEGDVLAARLQLDF